ncbi:MAG: hypothetical protein QCH99_03670 [Candidatus Bathyarchaeota archaeon]|nr:hypothetical protein [Candidatus Bathyarchaeum tardum]
MTEVEKNSILISVFWGVLLAVGLFYSVVLLSNTWIKWVVIGLALVCAAVWLIVHGRLKLIVKYFIVGLLVFGICFGSVEGHILENAGFAPEFEPITEGVLLSQSNILNVSVLQILGGVKNSPGYGLISLEHPGEITFESMSFDTIYPKGRIDVDFYQRSSNLGFHFTASNGNSYHARVMEWRNLPLSQTFAQKQSAEHSLKQIDALGLNWFYSVAVDEYQNQTGTTPRIDAIQISIQWESYQDYQGLTLLIMAIKIDNSDGHGMFYANFQPDGTLLYLNVASG